MSDKVNFQSSTKTALLNFIKTPTVSRALHTFWQGFLVTFVVGIPLVVAVANTGGLDEGQKALVSLLVACCMAGLSAVKTAVVGTVKSIKEM